MRGLRRPGSIDLSIYARGVAILATTPVLIIPIFVAHLIVLIVFQAAPGGGGVAGIVGGSISSIIAQIVYGFGFGIALIGADLAWRGQRRSLPIVWDEARRKFAQIAWGTIGFNFVLWAVSSIFSYVIPQGEIGYLLSIAVSAFALFFVIYMQPAAANGGIPGTAAINVSVEQARDNPGVTGIITAVYGLVTYVAPIFVIPYALSAIYVAAPQLLEYGLAFVLIETLLLSILSAYVAVVLAKVYDDVATRRFFR